MPRAHVHRDRNWYPHKVASVRPVLPLDERGGGPEATASGHGLLFFE